MHHRENFSPDDMVTGIYTALVYMKVYMFVYRNLFNI